MLRRTVFLLAGGAIAVALGILASAVYAPLLDDAQESTAAYLLLWLVLSATAGLLPGLRDIEVAGARDLLRVPPDAVVVPEPTRWEHRWRTALWTLLHQLVGFLAGLVLTLGLIRPWGEVFPRWMPMVAGRPVPVRFAAVPGGLVAAALCASALPFALHGVQGVALLASFLVLPFWLWGPALALAVWGYLLHRRQDAVTTGGPAADVGSSRPGGSWAASPAGSRR